MPHKIGAKTKLKIVVAILAALLAVGCASTPDLKKPEPPVFPPPPAEPRFIFEASLRSSSNIQEPTFAEKLREIATGDTVTPFGLGKPYGVVAHKNNVFITDTQQRAIVLFDLNNRKVKLFGNEGPGSLLKPLGIDISKEEEVFVADITAKRVVVFDLQGNYLRSIGDANIFSRPVSVATDPTSDKIYVVDTGGLESDSHHVLVFNRKTGKYIETIGKRGRAADEFNIPLQASVTNDGTLYVVDSGNFRVQRINKEGEFTGSFGGIGRQSGQFSRPKGIATDTEGNVYVVDTAFGNVQVFNPDGELLLFMGDRATSGGPGRYSLPAGVDVDENGKIYIVDQFFRKVDIIRPLDAKPFDVFLTQ